MYTLFVKNRQRPRYIRRIESREGSADVLNGTWFRMPPGGNTELGEGTYEVAEMGQYVGTVISESTRTLTVTGGELILDGAPYERKSRKHPLFDQHGIVILFQ